MNYSNLLHACALAAPAAPRIFSPRRFGAAAALALSLVLGAGLLTVSNTSYAEEAAAQSGAAQPAAVTVNINSDDAEMLAAGLIGVGQSRAIEIVRYREAYGPFASIDELAEVKGIGKSTLDKNRTVITLD